MGDAHNFLGDLYLNGTTILFDMYTSLSVMSCVYFLLCTQFRHWQKLMESTKQNFDMNPETFTLENLFAMQLHNYADTIVTSASKELSIERGINEVVETWQ